jgi:DNA-binding transcriptional regulator YhcF (GntR family)
LNYNIEGHSNLYKDSESSGVITKKDPEHKKRIEASKRINTVINDVKYLKEEMSEIKQLLKDIRDDN